MRAASQIDFRTAVKMSQQASACSSLPTLTPLPTYASQVVDECYSYQKNTDQDMTGYTSSMESNGLPTSGCLTPQTPESLIYHEPLTIGEMTDTWMVAQPWLDDSLASVGLGFQSDIGELLPAELWSTSERTQSAPIAQLPWVQSFLSFSPQSIASDLLSHSRGAPSLSFSECSVEDFNSSGVFHEDWANHQPTTNQFNIANTVVSAPFMHGLLPVSATTHVWEDVFIPGSATY
jgi:hypothetical protein